MTEIETRRTQRGATDDDWKIEVVGLTNEEAMSVSAFVSQIIMARRGGFENYEASIALMEEVASILTKRAQPPLTRPEPGNRFSGLDLTKGDE
jgi:hypothetical protein